MMNLSIEKLRSAILNTKRMIQFVCYKSDLKVKPDSLCSKLALSVLVITTSVCIQVNISYMWLKLEPLITALFESNQINTLIVISVLIISTVYKKYKAFMLFKSLINWIEKPNMKPYG